MEQGNTTTVTERLLQEAPNFFHLPADYSDDDLIIFDNIKFFAESEPVKPNLNVMAICTQGRLAAKMNGETVEVHANEMFLCPPNVVIEDIMVSPDFAYVALGITTRGMQAFLQNNLNLWNQAMYVNRVKVLKFSERDILFYKKFYELIRLCIDAGRDYAGQLQPYRQEVLLTLVRSALLGLCNVLVQNLQQTRSLQMENEDGRPHNGNVFNRFLELLQKSEIKHQPVEYFANKLCVTPKYLTVACKKNSGKTANAWITEYTLADIAYYLKSTDIPIKEVATRLGFPNASFFGKFVKDHFNMSPKRYRMLNR